MTPLDQLVCSLSNPSRTASEVARLAVCDRSHVYRCAVRYGLQLKQRASKKQGNSDLTDKILRLADGMTRSKDIAEFLGCSDRHVQNILRMHNAPRMNQGAQNGSLNHSYKCGRMIDLDGYALVRAPDDHPYKRRSGLMFEHRLVAEQSIGRHLLPSEIVDHIDGLHLHNSPSNLRVFDSNADHLRATISGKVPNWSSEGLAKMKAPYRQRKEIPQIDSYRTRKASGDVRLLQILLAASRLGIDSPFLLGTRLHLEKAQIDCSSQTTIERALAFLFQKLE